MSVDATVGLEFLEVGLLSNVPEVKNIFMNCCLFCKCNTLIKYAKATTVLTIFLSLYAQYRKAQLPMEEFLYSVQPAA